jgi:hypothetical protein
MGIRVLAVIFLAAAVLIVIWVGFLTAFWMAAAKDSLDQAPAPKDIPKPT